MGNNNQKRIVILDDSQNTEGVYNDILHNNNLKLIFYNEFEDFIEKENPKQLQSVIVRLANKRRQIGKVEKQQTQKNIKNNNVLAEEQIKHSNNKQ